MSEFRYLLSDSTDPSWNLAAEQYVFDSLPRAASYLMLWQNDRAIIIGKYQNTLAEINKAYVDTRGIRVVRRLSGGGAVYHDLGNLNYTLITDAGNLDQLNLHMFCVPVVRTLEKLGVNAEISGRNDITVDGRKISGNSQYLRGGRIMHHGTLLFDSDLSAVDQALHVDEEKIQSKGVRSVRSRVTNIRPLLAQDCTLLEFRALLLESFLRENVGTRYTFSDQDRRAIEKLRQERYASWEWNYGSSRTCSMIKKHRFEVCGTLEVSICLDAGRIKALHFAGDFFSLREPEELAARLIGLRLEESDIAAALSDCEVERYFLGLRTS